MLEEVRPESTPKAFSRLWYLKPREAGAVLLLWAAWSAGTVLLASAAMRLPVANSSPWTAVMHAPPLARWDSVWYRSVAVDGYTYDPNQPENNVGFYPLYPLIVRWLAAILQTPVLLTGIAVSLACLAGALVLMADLFVEWGGAGTGLASAAALLFYPTAFFLASVYAESLFLLSAVAALWSARRGHWILAGIAGCCGSLTRFNGALLVPAIAAYALLHIRESSAKDRVRPVLGVLIALAGGLLYPLYLWSRWGDPLLYVHSKIAGWPVRPGPFWTLIGRVWEETWSHVTGQASSSGVILIVQLFSVILFVVLTVEVFRRRLLPEGIFTGATLLLLLSSGTLDGVQRYVLVLFPCLFPIALWMRRHPVAGLVYAFAGVGVGMILLHRFVHWIFVG